MLSKGAFNALLEGIEIGATTIQFFTANQKTWKGKALEEKSIKKWEEIRLMSNIQKIMSHDSYLINLGSPKQDVLEKSKQAFHDELLRCHLLKVDFLNFHPGAALDSPVEKCLDTIVESLTSLKKIAEKGETRLLIETTAGQGSTVGYSFSQIGYLVDQLQALIPIGVCIDTCHIFAAGYDIRTKEGWDLCLKEFEEKIGLRHLYALHVNDSLKPLGSRKDRHASLGKGEIGLDSFKYMMRHPLLKHLPKYLETPEGPSVWKQEIQLLRDFAK